MNAISTNPTRGYPIAMLSALVLSTTGLFIRHLTHVYEMPSGALSFWRAIFSALSLGLALALLSPKRLRPGPGNLGFLLTFGAVQAVFNATWTPAVALTGAAIATVLVNASSAFTVVLGWWFLKEPLGIAKAVAVALCLTGCALVANVLHPSLWKVNGWGLLAGLGSGLCYAVYSLMGRTASRRGLDPWTSALYTFAFAALFLVLPGLWSGAPVRDLWLNGPIEGWGWLLLLAAGPTVIGFGLYNTSLKHLPSGVANLIVSTEPVFTTLAAFYLFGERLTGPQLLGGALILSGVFVLRLSERQRTPTESSTPTAMGEVLGA